MNSYVNPRGHAGVPCDLDPRDDAIERLTRERDNLRNVSEQYRKNSNEQFERANRAEDARDEAYARGFHDAQEKARVEGRLEVVDSPELSGLRAQVAALRKALDAVMTPQDEPHETMLDVREALTDTAAAAAAHDARKIREGMERAAKIALAVAYHDERDDVIACHAIRAAMEDVK